MRLFHLTVDGIQPDPTAFLVHHGYPKRRALSSSVSIRKSLHSSKNPLYCKICNRGSKPPVRMTDGPEPEPIR
jgi:hypothetical protein